MSQYEDSDAEYQRELDEYNRKYNAIYDEWEARQERIRQIYDGKDDSIVYHPGFNPKPPAYKPPRRRW